MRIQVINGNTFEPMTAGIATSAISACAPETEIIAAQPNTGPESIESYYDEYLAIPGILEVIVQAELQAESKVNSPIDAFVIACWGDPGIEAAREITTRPVVGIAEASMYVANLIAARWGVITTQHRTRRMIEHTIHKTGFAHRCVSICTTGIPVTKTETDRQTTVDILAIEAEKAVKRDRVEAFCLGCAGMTGLDVELEQRVGIPFIDAVAAGVKLAESLVALGKTNSKHLTYQRPTAKPFQGYPAHMQPQNWRSST
ncbi:MAG: aspartate/glutamate racemase family protein [Cyanobacteria bacterium P01_H01_bin.121]